MKQLHSTQSFLLTRPPDINSTKDKLIRQQIDLRGGGCRENSDAIHLDASCSAAGYGGFDSGDFLPPSGRGSNQEGKRHG
jgi:hypothetical protein